MNDNEVKLTGTGIVWTAYTIIMVVSLAKADEIGGGLFMAAALMFTIAALVVTNIVWRRQGGEFLATENTEKAKRASRLDRVLEQMDEAELSELRARLTANSDGEITSLDDLLAEKQQR